MVRSDKTNKNKIFTDRIMILQYIFVILVGIFILYLFCVQVLDTRHFRIKAKKQRKAYSFVMRGNIYDRNGIKLATDTVYYDIFARKADFIHTPEELAKLLAPILKISQVNLTETLKQDTPMILIKKNVDRHTRDKIAQLNLREIPMDKKSVRTYPQGTLAAHVLGYYNFDADVASGVEYTAKDKLESAADGVDLEITPKGKIIFFEAGRGSCSKQTTPNIYQYHPIRSRGYATHSPIGSTAAMYQFDRCVNLIFVAVLFHTVFCVNLT